ncbi:MAG TPA: NADH-quinone oxidoreductase subunit L [Phycisphaerae bacterium]|nr:NADH-quinone oxidoreductase subunit L [Phycisphaerae bacterium]HPC23809.1 NADH-quinone oxidoreductase subunit L [Phycisphaerae bacterium]
MLGLLWLVPVLPLAAFVLLALGGARMPRAAVSALGVGLPAAAAVIAALIAITFGASPPAGHSYTQVLWTWMPVAGADFMPQFALHLDALSIVMMLVVTWVGSLILLYSSEFMEGEEGYSRYFAYMDLFISSMLFLVLARDLLVLFLGWEGVGLCSYLLIGFWYRDENNVRAANKAFIVTRVGDTAFAIGLFLLFSSLGTLDIPEVLTRAAQQWPAGSAVAAAAAALLLGGAVGKSAQLPLQTWLPDAMAGPSPVSALIHAATMVTAGVYLIARMHVIFTLSPLVQWFVALVGALTLLLAACAALVQRDIKRVLAYSTISQIGYMFLALGVGAWTAAIFHFMTHAFFKSLLFLAAGVVILAMHHEHNMFAMGGLRRRMPVTFWTFLAGGLALSAFPLISAGFYSKDLILFEAFTLPRGNVLFWLAGFVGSLLTAIYTGRMVFLTFFGPAKHEPARQPRWRMQTPLIVLGVLAICGGFINVPDFLRTALPAPPESGHSGLQIGLEFATGALVIVGILVAAALFVWRRAWADALYRLPGMAGVHAFLFSGWGFDWVYDHALVRPFVTLARINRRDFIDFFYTAVAWLNIGGHRVLSATENGRLRWYAAGIAAGAVIVIAIMVL